MKEVTHIRNGATIITLNQDGGEANLHTYSSINAAKRESRSLRDRGFNVRRSPKSKKKAPRIEVLSSHARCWTKEQREKFKNYTKHDRWALSRRM